MSELAARPAPHLTIVKQSSTRLGATSAGPVVLHETEDGADALVLILSNAGAPISHVIAEIIFLDGEHEVCGGTGTWVGRFQNSVDFEPAQRHQLVIAIREADKQPYAVLNSRSNGLPTRPVRAYIRALERAAPLDYRVLPARSLEVRVSLFDGDGLSLVPTALFTFADTGGGFTLVSR